jgi:hypothetical protein
MTVRAARRLVFGLLGLYTVFLTYPGMVPFNRIEPLVLGLPFSMFWIVLWVAIVFAGLLLLNRLETRDEASSGIGAGPAPQPEPSGQGAADRG